MVESVDDDKTGEIEFPEFLSIIKASESKVETPMATFFKNLC